MSSNTFQEVNKRNVARTIKNWHSEGLEEWSVAEWGCALAGETGELCNILKKYKRLEGDESDKAVEAKMTLIGEAAEEIGDVYVYLDLVAEVLGLDIYTCIRDKFNKESDRAGSDIRLD